MLAPRSHPLKEQGGEERREQGHPLEGMARLALQEVEKQKRKDEGKQKDEERHQSAIREKEAEKQRRKEEQEQREREKMKKEELRQQQVKQKLADQRRKAEMQKTIEEELLGEIKKKTKPDNLLAWVKSRAAEMMYDSPASEMGWGKDIMASSLVTVLARLAGEEREDVVRTAACTLKKNVAFKEEAIEADETVSSTNDAPTGTSSSILKLPKEAVGQDDVEKEVVKRFQPVLQALLPTPRLQLGALYTLQVYCHGLDFPRGLLVRWFIALYVADVVEEEVFHGWREDVDDSYPGKGRALVQVNAWLTWLQEAEEEETDNDLSDTSF